MMRLSTQVITISGGISNALYKVSIKIEDLTPAVIVLRVYGENTEKFVDRGEEVALMQKLNKSGFGPQVRFAVDCGVECSHIVYITWLCVKECQDNLNAGNGNV